MHVWSCCSRIVFYVLFKSFIDHHLPLIKCLLSHMCPVFFVLFVSPFPSLCCVCMAPLPPLPVFMHGTCWEELEPPSCHSSRLQFNKNMTMSCFTLPACTPDIAPHRKKKNKNPPSGVTLAVTFILAATFLAAVLEESGAAPRAPEVNVTGSKVKICAVLLMEKGRQWPCCFLCFKN